MTQLSSRQVVINIKKLIKKLKTERNYFYFSFKEKPITIITS